jgi:large subunit ribosomal protein L25
MRVPLHFLNEANCPSVKAGGIISHLMNDLEIKCLPRDLPEYIGVDTATLQLDSAIHLSDITLPTGVELTQELDEAHNPTVVSAHRPRVDADSATDITDASESSPGAEKTADEGKAAKG